jgi:hypothetical protein
MWKLAQSLVAQQVHRSALRRNDCQNPASAHELPLRWRMARWQKKTCVAPHMKAFRLSLEVQQPARTSTTPAK